MAERVYYCNDRYEPIIVEKDCPQISARLFRCYQTVYKYLVVEVDRDAYNRKFADGKRRGFIMHSAHLRHDTALKEATESNKRYGTATVEYVVFARTKLALDK